MAARAEVASGVNRDCASGDSVATENREQAYRARCQRCAVNRAAGCNRTGESQFADAVVTGCAREAVVAGRGAAQGRANRFNAGVGTRLQVAARAEVASGINRDCACCDNVTVY